MFPSCIPWTGSICWSGGDASFQVNPSSVERNMPICSVPSHKSPAIGFTPRPNTLPPLLGEIVAAVVVSPPLVETQAPLFGYGDQYPPHTTLVLGAKMHPVRAVTELR